MLPYLVTSKKNRQKLQVTQNNILKVILRLPRLTNTKLLHQITNTEPLNQRIFSLAIKYISNSNNNGYALIKGQKEQKKMTA